MRYELDEIEYTESEEQEVIKELRLGLMLGEISRKITKKQLKDWFANLQLNLSNNASDTKVKKIKKKNDWCENITGQDLVEIAKSCGLKILEG